MTNPGAVALAAATLTTIGLTLAVTQSRSAYVWNNSGGDSATLRTASGGYVDTCGWGKVSSYVNC